MINIFLACLLSSIIVLSYGITFSNLILKKKTNNTSYNELGLFGFIIIALIGLIINFIFPLNRIVGTFFLIFAAIYFIKSFINSSSKDLLVYNIIFTSFITFSIITLSNINRPDAGLYHLPYISLLNENKIIFGITNLHYRFGHTSSFQYISALYHNYFFKNEFLNLPLASLFSFYVLFMLEKFREIQKKNNDYLIVIFLIIIFSLYSFNRYSNYGNDAPVHIYFYILIIFLLTSSNLRKINSEDFYKISLISIFLFTLKPFMMIVLIIPLLLYFFNYKKNTLIKNYRLYLCFFFLIIWFIKNLIISGCLIFPIKSTCFSKFKFFDEKTVNIASKEAEAWSKGFPDQFENKLNIEKYNTNFNWLKTWKSNHLKKINEKIFPFFFFLIIILLPSIIMRIYNRNFSLNKILINKNIFFLIIFSFFCCIFWFLKFPVYRFGLSFISIFIILIYCIIFIKIDTLKSKNNPFFWSLIIITFIIIGFKNYKRIINNYEYSYINFPWPRIYTLSNLEKNVPKKFEEIRDKNKKIIFYYSNGTECMYSKSPCTNIKKNNIKREIKAGYLIFYIDKKID